jgi:hypothetical protein
MAINHALTIRYYLRMLAWIFILYVVWCFAPALYNAAHFRMDVYREVADGASSGREPEQIRENLLYKAALLKLPLKPEDLEVTADVREQRVSARYSYGTTVRCFRQVVPLDFHGSTSAESTISLHKGTPTGNPSIR